MWTYTIHTHILSLFTPNAFCRWRLLAGRRLAKLAWLPPHQRRQIYIKYVTVLFAAHPNLGVTRKSTHIDGGFFVVVFLHVVSATGSDCVFAARKCVPRRIVGDGVRCVCVCWCSRLGNLNCCLHIPHATGCYPMRARTFSPPATTTKTLTAVARTDTWAPAAMNRFKAKWRTFAP